MSYSLLDRLPTEAEYRALCTSVGWADMMNLDAVGESLARSLYGVVVQDEDGSTIGMGRLVGDGVMYFYVQDVAIHPDHQRQGVGTLIMQALIDWWLAHSVRGAFIGLFSTPEAEPLYRNFGLDAYPALRGMFTARALHPPAKG